VSDIIEKIKCKQCGLEIFTPTELNNLGILTEKIKCKQCGLLNILEITPVVTSSPVDDAVSVPRNSNIVLTFNVSMDEASVIDNLSITPSIVNVKTFDVASKVLTIDPTGNFLPLTEYEVALTRSAKSNNDIALKTAVSITFTTSESASANNLVAGIPALGSPALTSNSAIPNSLLAGVPVLGSPALTANV
jgi:hypothetical protein